MKLPILLCMLSVILFGTVSAQQNGSRITIAHAEQRSVLERMNAQMIPRVDFEDTRLDEAVDFLRLSGADYDRLETAPKRFSIVLVDCDLDHRKINSLFLRNVSLYDLLNQIAALTNTCIYTGSNVIEFYDGERHAPNRRTPPAGKAMDEANAVIIPRLDFVDTPITDAVEFLNSRVPEIDDSKIEVRIVIDPSVDPDALVPAIRTRDISLGHAAFLLSLRTGLRLTVDGNTLRIVKQPAKQHE